MRVGPERKLTAKELMLLNCGVREDSWEPPGLQRAQTSQYYRKSILNIHWKDWCWSSNTLAPWWKELTHWKRPQYWEKLKVGGEGDGREWNGWMASLTQWTWVWASSRSWWWMGKPGVLRFMGSQRIRHDWVTELNWTEEWLFRIKDKNYRIISINAEKTFDKIQHLFRRKTLNKLGIEGMYVNIIKVTYKKSASNITLDNGRLKTFLLGPGTRRKCPLSLPYST